jgi:hypothetical protein
MAPAEDLLAARVTLMPETRSMKCPNCSAPMEVPLGEVEMTCSYCESGIRFIPGSEEMEVVRTREELKSRERLAAEQERIRKEHERQESEAWRKTATDVALKALPVIGGSAGRALYRAALGRRRGCLGCGCALPFVVAALSTAAVALVALF